MPVWLAVAVCAAFRLLTITLNWMGRVRYERARSRLIVRILETAYPGTILREERGDGTTLHIAVPGRGDQRLVTATHLRASGRLDVGSW
jgi:hypothetical protein